MEITPQGSHQTQSILGCGGYSEQQQSKNLCHYHCTQGLSNGLRAGKTATLTGPLATWLTQHPTAHLLFTKDVPPWKRFESAFHSHSETKALWELLFFSSAVISKAHYFLWDGLSAPSPILEGLRQTSSPRQKYLHIKKAGLRPLFFFAVIWFVHAQSLANKEFYVHEL